MEIEIRVGSQSYVAWDLSLNSPQYIQKPGMKILSPWGYFEEKSKKGFKSHSTVGSQCMRVVYVEETSKEF